MHMNKTFMKEFKKNSEAMSLMRSMNYTTRRATKNRQVVAVVPSANNGFAVVDIKTAIELGLGYIWEN